MRQLKFTFVCIRDFMGEDMVIIAIFNTSLFFIYRWLCSTNRSNELLCRRKPLFSTILGVATGLTWLLVVLSFVSSAFYQLIYVGFVSLCSLSNWSIVCLSFIYCPSAFIAVLSRIVEIIPSSKLKKKAKENLTVSTARMILFLQLVLCGLIWIAMSAMAFLFAFLLNFS